MRGERGLVDHRPARGVDDDRGRFHQFEFVLADHVARRSVQRDMQRHDIGGAQQFAQQAELHIVPVGLAFGQPRDIEILHAHAERLREPRNLLADRSEANDAERFVVAARTCAAPARCRASARRRRWRAARPLCAPQSASTSSHARTTEIGVGAAVIRQPAPWRAAAASRSTLS